MLIAILTAGFIPAIVWTVYGTRDLCHASAHSEPGHYDPSWWIEVAIWTTLSLLVSIGLIVLAALIHLGFLSETETLMPMLCELTAMVLLQVLNREFKRAISIGHKPFVNPWCDDIAAECHRPEFD